MWICDKQIFFTIQKPLGTYKLSWNVSENLRPILMYRYLCMSLKCFMSKAFCSYFYIYCKHMNIYYLYKNIFTCISCSREMATTLRINHPSIHSFSHPTDQPTVWALRWSTFYIYCNLHKNVFLWGKKLRLFVLHRNMRMSVECTCAYKYLITHTSCCSHTSHITLYIHMILIIHTYDTKPIWSVTHSKCSLNISGLDESSKRQKWWKMFNILMIAR